MSASHSVISPKKLIEVALPLDAINTAAAREKSIRHGHPSTLHLWWARRPLAAARAVIFSQLVNDPEDLWRCQNPGKEPSPHDKGNWTKARARLFKLIEELVVWENTTNEDVLGRAREEIRKSWREVCELNQDHPQAAELFNQEKLPGLHDPFAGGGTIPLEAQRLGLEAYASDLNPVAVLINKAMIEIPPMFAGKPPVHPQTRRDRKEAELFASGELRGAAGLADDVRYYGKWMRDEAFQRIGHLYPPIEITRDMAAERDDLQPYVGEKLTVIAWLWARTVKSPNPAYSHVDVPLTGSFVLSRMRGNEAYINVSVASDSYRFEVISGSPESSACMQNGTKTSPGTFRCIVSDAPISSDYIREEAAKGRLGSRLMAVVADGPRGRLYLSPTPESEALAKSAMPKWRPDTPFFAHALGFRVGNYGMSKWSDLYTDRQLVALDCFCDLVLQVQRLIESSLRDSHNEPNNPLSYGTAIAVYLSFAVSGLAARLSTLCAWDAGGKTWGTKVNQTFGRQTVQMTWDYCEANPFSGQSGSFENSLDYTQKGILACASSPGVVRQRDARHQTLSINKIVATDPPYFDNIGYADLSDYFYVWLRRTLGSVFPELFATVSTPKNDELVATPARHGGRDRAEAFFLEGMADALRSIASQSFPGMPTTIFYAFKQSDTRSSLDTSSTGWETFLQAIRDAGLSVTGTWPMRTELRTRMRSNGSNALASSIVLVCRPRVLRDCAVSRRDFIRELNAALPIALDAMTRESEGMHSPVAPVDLSQAIIGPGMAIFSKYAAVLEADGSPMSVRTALQLINRFLAEDDFDADTQFCLHWFEQHGWNEGRFGEADVLARAKGTSVEGVKSAGVLYAAGGVVRLLKSAEYPGDWNPAADKRLPVWEVLHQLIRILRSYGESGAGAVLAHVQGKAEATRQLAYRLYTLCERANLAEDARAYNELVTSWSAIEAAAVREPTMIQREFLDLGDAR